MIPSAASASVNRRVLWPVAILVVPIVTLAFGLVLWALGLGPRTDRPTPNFSRLWGGLAVLSLTPFGIDFLERRITGRSTGTCIVVPAVLMRIVLFDGVGRSWLANFADALAVAGLILVVQMSILFIQRAVMRSRKRARAKAASPMWDADADQPLAAKGPI